MIVILFKNGIEVKRGKAEKIYPVKNMGVCESLDADLEWKILVEGVKPTITEIERLVKTEEDNDTQHDTYTHLKQIDAIYTVERKDDGELEILIREAEKNANEQLIDTETRLKLTVLYVALERRERQGLNITPKMQEVLDKGDEYATKLWLNDTELKNKLQQVINNENVDINANWTNG